jgi:hypothetical protein
VFARGARPLPADAQVLPLTGRWVIPGLIDGHVHLASVHRPPEVVDGLRRAALLGGVTAVRDMGGSVRQLSAAARRTPHDSVPSTRLYYSAVAVGAAWLATYDPARVAYWSDGAAPGTAPGVRRIDDTTDVRAFARAARSLGASAIKLLGDLPPGRLDDLVRAAHAEGLRVWSHGVVPPSPPGTLSRAGVDLLTHADQLVWQTAAAGDSVGDRRIRPRLLAAHAPASALVGALLDSMRARGTLFEPTLFVMMQSVERSGNADRLLHPDSLVGWAIGATRAAHARGVAIVAGTDALGGSTPNLQEELRLLVERGGLSPLEAIHAATGRGAQAIGVDSIGTIAAGKVADLVVLTADPSADIRNTRAIELVMKSGWIHRPPARR